MHALLAADNLPTLISEAPIPYFLSNSVTRATSIEKRDEFQYTIYGGGGEVSDGWPAISAWVPDFTTMFNNNLEVILSSCSQFSVANNSEDETNEISTAIQLVSASTGVDPRFILAIVLQESNGCVRAPTTSYGVRNPGLMQSHNGTGTCNDATVVNPCPQSKVTQMIQDGTGGTSTGDGLKQCLTETGVTDVSMYYKAARIYNSGSIAVGGNLGQGVAKHCYASDIANRLTGWSSGPGSCNAEAVAHLTGTMSYSGNTGEKSPTSRASSAPTTSVSSTLAATTPASSSPAAAALAMPSASGVPIYPGAVSPCQSYYTIAAGDYCDLVATKAVISFVELQTLNSGLDAVCSNLWLGYQYCVQS